jgi:hypothetical protein
MNDRMLDAARASVYEGGELLDRVARSDWRQLIDLDSLDMADTYLCLAGQVFGHWNAAPDVVRCQDAFGGWLDWDLDRDKFEALRLAWVEYLTP